MKLFILGLVVSPILFLVCNFLHKIAVFLWGDWETGELWGTIKKRKQRQKQLERFNKMNHKPLWEQYGFSSEAEFEKRYPKKSKVIAKPKNPLFGKRAMSKREQQKIDWYNNLGR